MHFFADISIFDKNTVSFVFCLPYCGKKNQKQVKSIDTHLRPTRYPTDTIGLKRKGVVFKTSKTVVNLEEHDEQVIFPKIFTILEGSSC